MNFFICEFLFFFFIHISLLCNVLTFLLFTKAHLCVACMCTLCSLLFGKAFVFRAKEYMCVRPKKRKQRAKQKKYKFDIVVSKNCCICMQCAYFQYFLIFAIVKSKHKFHIMAHFVHTPSPGSTTSYPILALPWIHCCFLLLGTPQSRFCPII